MDEETAVRMSARKLEVLKELDIDCIVLSCPYCNIMYDEYQNYIEERIAKELNIPVLFYTQLLGLALGLDWKRDLGLHKNAVNTRPTLQILGLL